jgi:vacuolar ATPase assembly integral membrane protein VMA21
MTDKAAISKVAAQAAQRWLLFATSSAHLLTFEILRSVLIKLVIFSVSLAFVPISVFFISQSYIWNGESFAWFSIIWRTEFVSGNATYAAITAVFAANAVLVAYIVLSVLEDRETLNSAELSKLAESRKEQ